ncbi:hypothetical protein [Microbacterium sp.]|uniref:hypothetical protein n=1 Tax=Microbacterium sp. TaxID=51671 RepID=UPI0039E3E10A
MVSTPSGRRLSPAVYRRRRLAVLLALLAVVAIVAVLIWQPWRGAPKAAPTPSASTRSAAPTTAPPTTPASEPSTEAAPTPSVSPTGEALDACTTANVSVTAVTDKESYASGELPQLSMTLTNDGDEACLINVGTTTQAFTITSGSDTWWRSTDCQTEPSDQVVTLDAHQTVSSLTPLQWDRTRSAVDTCSSARPAAPAGYFHLSVSVGGIDSVDDAVFVLG